MFYNFDEVIDRKNIRSTKWDFCNEKFGVDKNIDMIPMWVADMDFNSPIEVVEAIKERANVCNYGYSVLQDSFYESVINWFKRRYNLILSKEWIVLTPGVLPGLNIAIQSLTDVGDGIIIQEPVYYPFMEGINNNGRKIVNNQLIENDGKYEVDYEDLENKLKNKENKLMIISNPHNPVGKSFTKEELSKIGKLCVENDVILISDEIHSDLTMKGYKHEVMIDMSEDIKQNSIVMHSASKTFNLAGLQTAYNIIPNEKIRNKFINGLNKNRIFNMNFFGPIATEVAFNKCEYYANQLVDYVDKNMTYMKEFIDENIPSLKMEKSEATYLAWVDFRGLKKDYNEIENFVTHKSHIGVDYGSWFGDSGKGFLRFNIACPRSILEMAMKKLKDSLVVNKYL